MLKKTLIILSVLLTSSLSLSKPYKGGEYRTKQSFLYGRFEVRMKTANISGMLSSFFTYHDNDPDWKNNWNEIDFENMGRYNNESQVNVITPGQTNHFYRQKLNFNPHNAFHVYAIEWTPNYISWSIDGYEVYRQVESHISTVFRAQKLMMNIWQPSDVNWAGTFSPFDLPAYAFYDWVKYYDYTPGCNNNFTLGWADNFDFWDQNRWEKATHTFDGNNADFMTENVVFKDGYMILCLTNSTNLGYNGQPVVDKDIDPPYLVEARSFTSEILLYFSEKISKESAEKIDNYSISGVNIRGAKLLIDSQSVKLNVENFDTSISYVLVIQNINDCSISSNTLQFQHFEIKNCLSEPISVEVGGNQWNNYIKDQIWFFKKEYGYEGGTIIQKPGIQISKTSEQEIYQTALDGISFYKIRLANGNYLLTLLFAEISAILPEMRIFDIYVNGKLKVENVDISKETGINSALNKSFEVDINDNFLEIYFKAKTGKALLNGIKLKRNITNGIKSGKVFDDKPESEMNIFPNPFNLSTNFRYYLTKPGYVSLNVYDLNGKHVFTIDDGMRDYGEYNKYWNADNVASGMYYCTFVADSKMIVKKLFLLK